MNDNNVYKPPAAEVVAAVQKQPLSTGAKVVLVLLVFQVIFSGINTATFLEYARVGEMSVFSLLIYVLSFLLLAIGGLLLALKSKGPTILFAIAAAFAIIAAQQLLSMFSGWPNQPMFIGMQMQAPSILWQCQPILLISCVLLAASACYLSFKRNRS